MYTKTDNLLQTDRQIDLILFDTLSNFWLYYSYFQVLCVCVDR